MLVLRALQEQSIFHWDFMTKMRTTFIGHSREEMEKKKAFVSWQCRLRCLESIHSVKHVNVWTYL